MGEGSEVRSVLHEFVGEHTNHIVDDHGVGKIGDRPFYLDGLGSLLIRHHKGPVRISCDVFSLTRRSEGKEIETERIIGCVIYGASARGFVRGKSRQHANGVLFEQ